MFANKSKEITIARNLLVGLGLCLGGNRVRHWTTQTGFNPSRPTSVARTQQDSGWCACLALQHTSHEMAEPLLQSRWMMTRVMCVAKFGQGQECGGVWFWPGYRPHHALGCACTCAQLRSPGLMGQPRPPPMYSNAMNESMHVRFSAAHRDVRVSLWQDLHHIYIYIY